MESLSPSTSSGSLIDSAFARFLLAPDLEGSPAPRITELRFGDDFAGGDLAVSFSGQFGSFYGLPYDNSPPPEEQSQDVVPNSCPREPHVTSIAYNFSLPSIASFSPSASFMHKATEDAVGNASTTLFTNPHYLASDLVDIPSTFSTIQDTLDSLADALEEPEPHHTPLRTSQAPPTHTRLTSIPTSNPLSVPTPDPQPIARELRPVHDSMRPSILHRSMTVQQLALDLPLSRSRNNSLSALIHALEDASPGWYQSLMDSASSQAESLSPQTTDSSPVKHHQSLLTPPRSDKSFGHNIPTPRSSRGSSSGGLGDVLEELELLAIRIGRLPIPRPHTIALEVVKSVFFPPSTLPPLPPCPTRHASPPESPDLADDYARHERQSTVVPATPRPLVRDRVSFRQMVSAQIVPSLSSGSSISDNDTDNDTDRPAGMNYARRPKLDKALGLRSLPSASRVLAPAPKTPSWRKRDSSRARVVSESAPPVPPPTAVAIATPDVETKEAPPKRPRSAKFQSMFRIRPPPVPPVPAHVQMQVQVPDRSARESVPTPPTLRRVARLSEPPLPRRLNRASHQPVKNVKHFSTSVGPPSLPQGTLGSFLPM